MTISSWCPSQRDDHLFLVSVSKGWTSLLGVRLKGMDISSWCRSQRDEHLFLVSVSKGFNLFLVSVSKGFNLFLVSVSKGFLSWEVGNDVYMDQQVKKSSYHAGDFPVMVRDELTNGNNDESCILDTAIHRPSEKGDMNLLTIRNRVIDRNHRHRRIPQHGAHGHAQKQLEGFRSFDPGAAKVVQDDDLDPLHGDPGRVVEDLVHRHVVQTRCVKRLALQS